MLKILVRKWDKNKDRLRKYLEEAVNLNSCSYLDLVKMTFMALVHVAILFRQFRMDMIRSWPDSRL